MTGCLSHALSRGLWLAVISGLTAFSGISDAEADDATIEVFGSIFLPLSVQVDVGNTVTWQWVAGDHVITSGFPGGTLGTPDEPGLLFEETLDAANPTFSYTFTAVSPTGYPFHDSLNPAVIGFVDVSGAEMTFPVTVLDNSFVPDTIAIFAGDSVRWEHEPGEALHTVTSGASSDLADSPGALFDEVSSDAFPVFLFTFSDPADQPYFCIPHEAFGMVGLVIVQRHFLRGDANDDGDVNLSDAVSVLSHLFSGGVLDCRDAGDANDDGAVDLSDPIYLLSYSFTGGPAPAAPFPAEGADRTDDDLLCR